MQSNSTLLWAAVSRGKTSRKSQLPLWKTLARPTAVDCRDLTNSLTPCLCLKFPLLRRPRDTHLTCGFSKIVLADRGCVLGTTDGVAASCLSIGIS